MKKYNERRGQRWRYAAEQIESMLHNNARWDLFKRQLESRKNPMIDQVDKIREGLIRGKLTEQAYKDQLALLQLAYTSCTVFICDDGCKYNPKSRKGARKYTKPRKFYCHWTISLKDRVAEEFAERQAKGEEFEGISKGLLWSGPDGKDRFYAYGNPEFEKRTSVDEILKQHTDPTKPPEWLDAERNICPYYYVDLSKS